MMHRMAARSMARSTRVVLAAAGSLLVIPAASAQQFSADVVVLGAPADAPSRTIHVSGGKLRAETTGPAGTVMVVDAAANTAVLLLPQEKVFADMRGLGQMNPAFMPVDVDDPCGTWQKAAAGGGQDLRWTCRRLSTETVNGREAIKYAASSSKGDDGFVWIDPKLKFMVKSANAAGQGMELRNIREAPQPPGLFEIPAGYKQQELPQMLQQMRQLPPAGKAP
jgi:hypothetical protein